MRFWNKNKKSHSSILEMSANRAILNWKSADLTVRIKQEKRGETTTWTAWKGRKIDMAQKNSNLNTAKSAKNDEFYTQLTDIEKELKYYKSHFEGKTVFCNCDDPTWSEFWRYFHLNFSELKLKKLISTHYDLNSSTYKLEYTGGDDNNIEVGIKTPLTGNGDFRSDECIALLKEADICCTNPPFSLFRSFLGQLIEHDKKFIIIGNSNAITYKEVFPLLKDNKVWLGNNYVKEFRKPDGTIQKFGNICWFTNLDIDKRHEELILWKKYSPSDYPTYDNYNAINVDKLTDIPCDYNGVMGVPITFLDKYNPSQFQILGLTSGRCEFDQAAWPTKKYIHALQHNKDGSVVNGSKANTRATIAIPTPTNATYYTADNATSALSIVYARILIRRVADGRID